MVASLIVPLREFLPSFLEIYFPPRWTYLDTCYLRNFIERNSSIDVAAGERGGLLGWRVYLVSIPLLTVSPSSSIIIKTARNDIYSRLTWINPGGKLGIKARLVTTLHDYIEPGKGKQRPFISKLLN